MALRGTARHTQGLRESWLTVHTQPWTRGACAPGTALSARPPGTPARGSWALPAAPRGVSSSLCASASAHGPLWPIGHPPALQSSLQGAGRAEECSWSDRERGRLSSDKQSRGSREPFWHLSLLLSERSSLPDHRCLWPPVTRWRVHERSGHTDHAATHLAWRPASLASCPGGCPYQSIQRKM